MERGEFGEHGCCALRRRPIFLQAIESRSGIYRCRPTFIATMRRKIARVIRRCLPKSGVRSPRRRPDCTSPRRFWMRWSPEEVEIARVTLHVGLGTFAPLRVERVEKGGSTALRVLLHFVARSRDHQSREAGRPAGCRGGNDGGAHAGVGRATFAATFALWIESGTQGTGANAAFRPNGDLYPAWIRISHRQCSAD